MYIVTNVTLCLTPVPRCVGALHLEECANVSHDQCATVCLLITAGPVLFKHPTDLHPLVTTEECAYVRPEQE